MPAESREVTKGRHKIIALVWVRGQTSARGEMADALDLGSSVEKHVGSNPTDRINIELMRTYVNA